MYTYWLYGFAVTVIEAFSMGVIVVNSDNTVIVVSN